MTEDIFELSILTKNNICYKYRNTKEAFEHFFSLFVHCFQSSTKVRLLKAFLEREDCKEYKEFGVFVSEEYKTISCRTMNYISEYTGDNISFFKNVKKNKNIRKFCRMIDELGGKEVNMFEIHDMYRSVYECVWCRDNKHNIKELIIYDAVISFFKYPEVKRKQV